MQQKMLDCQTQKSMARPLVGTLMLTNNRGLFKKQIIEGNVKEGAKTLNYAHTFASEIRTIECTSSSRRSGPGATVCSYLLCNLLLRAANILIERMSPHFTAK